MDKWQAFLAAYWQLLAAVAGLLVVVVAIKIWWAEVRYWVMRMAWSLPVIGRIQRAAGKVQRIGNDGWYPVETQLCSDFYTHYKQFNLSPDYFKKCEDYLEKAEEQGRSEKGPMLWLLIVGLILLEAVGFAYVLAPFMTKNASTNEQAMLAWFIAFLLSIAAVVLTELTGKEWHKNELVTKIREWWSNEGESARRNLQPEKGISLDNSYVDAPSPKYIQLLNRIPANATVTPSYKVAVATLVYIIFLAVGAYLIRSYTLEADTTEAVNQGNIFASEQAPANDPFALLEQGADGIELPAEMADVNAAADTKAKDEATVARTSASKVTFIILSVIFVMIQVVGIYFGYAFSLVGKESKKARHYTRKFNSADELNDWQNLKRELIEAEADAHLQKLQEKLSRRAVTSVDEQAALKGGLAKRSFRAFLHSKAQKAADAEAQAERAKAEQAKAQTAPVKAEAAAPVVAEAAPVVAQAVAPAAAPVAAAVAASQPFEVPAELADLDLTRLDENDLAGLADDFGISLDGLKKQQRLARLKAKAGTTT